MEYCERLSSCPFYNEKLKDLPAMAEGFKKMYCFNIKPNCARYILLKALGPEKVPVELFPNEIEKPKLSSKKKKADLLADTCSRFVFLSKS